MNDYERECERTRILARDIRENRRLDALVKIHYQRQEQELAWRSEKEYLARSNAIHVKETRLRRRNRQKGTEAAQSRQSVKSDSRTISKDQTDLDDVSSNSENLISSSKPSTQSGSSSESDDHTETEAPTIPKRQPTPIPPFTEEIMLSLPGRHQSMTYSPNNTGTFPLLLPFIQQYKANKTHSNPHPPPKTPPSNPHSSITKLHYFTPPPLRQRRHYPPSLHPFTIKHIQPLLQPPRRAHPPHNHQAPLCTEAGRDGT